MTNLLNLINDIQLKKVDSKRANEYSSDSLKEYGICPDGGWKLPFKRSVTTSNKAMTNKGTVGKALNAASTPTETITPPIVKGDKKLEDIVPTEIVDIEAELYNTSAFAKAGARIYTGFKSDVQIPTPDKITVGWSYNGAVDGNVTFTSKTMKPHRVTCFVNISSQVLNQSTNLENIIIREIAKAINEKIESTILSTKELENAPIGLFNGKSATTVSDYNSIIALESKVKDSSNYSYICSSEVKQSLRKTAKNTSENIYNNNAIDYTPTFVTSNMESKYLAYGDWSNLIIGFWGDGLDFTLDYVTGAKDGIVKLTVNCYVDYCFLSDNSKLSIGKIA